MAADQILKGLGLGFHPYPGGLVLGATVLTPSSSSTPHAAQSTYLLSSCYTSDTVLESGVVIQETKRTKIPLPMELTFS